MASLSTLAEISFGSKTGCRPQQLARWLVIEGGVLAFRGINKDVITELGECDPDRGARGARFDLT